MLYQLSKLIAGICFNIINIFLGGNLPPFTCVSVIVKEERGYLAVRRNNGDSVFPGGFVRWREHPEDAARREGKEETGYEISIGEMVGYQIYVSKRWDMMSALNLIYSGEIENGIIHHGSMEGKPYWLAEEDVSQRLAPSAQDVLKEYLHHQEQCKQLKTIKDE
jgi:8-oxo-dGTP pyrophosphatase MutT (NUDIX family)